jgi:hypothetical protein
MLHDEEFFASAIPMQFLLPRLKRFKRNVRQRSDPHSFAVIEPRRSSHAAAVSVVVSALRSAATT